MERSPCGEVDSRSAGQVIVVFTNGPCSEAVESSLHPPSHFFKTHYNILPPHGIFSSSLLLKILCSFLISYVMTKWIPRYQSMARRQFVYGGG
jgi:hypothetical protein